MAKGPLNGAAYCARLAESCRSWIARPMIHHGCCSRSLPASGRPSLGSGNRCFAGVCQNYSLLRRALRNRSPYSASPKVAQSRRSHPPRGAARQDGASTLAFADNSYMTRISVAASGVASGRGSAGLVKLLSSPAGIVRATRLSGSRAGAKLSRKQPAARPSP